jgi:hypothetical protein
MTRLNAAALAVLVSLSGKGCGESLLNLLGNREYAAMAGTFTVHSEGLSGAARAAFLIDLSTAVMSEEIRWMEESGTN